MKCLTLSDTFRLMADNVIAPTLMNFSNLSYLKDDFKLRLLIDICTMFDGQPVTYVTILNLKKKKTKSLSYRKKAYYFNYSYSLHITYFSYI